MDRPLHLSRGDMDARPVRCCVCARPPSSEGAVIVAYSLWGRVRSVKRVGFVCSAGCALDAWPDEETVLHPVSKMSDMLSWGERLIAEDDWPTLLVVDLFSMLAMLRTLDGADRR